MNKVIRLFQIRLYLHEKYVKPFGGITCLHVYVSIVNSD